MDPALQLNKLLDRCPAELSDVRKCLDAAMCDLVEITGAHRAAQDESR